MREKYKIIIVALGILFLASFFRLYGVNWDQDQHLHPDERFLTMVANGIAWPKNLTEYLDTATSPLNPHNRGYGFFVYGTFPIFFTKWVAEGLGKGDYGNLTLIGRSLSGFFDLGTVILVLLIAKSVIPTKSRSDRDAWRDLPSLEDSSDPPAGGLGMTLPKNWIFPLLAMFFYAASVLPIQLSHFFAVETYLTFFIALSFYLLIKIISNTQKGNKLITCNLKLTTLLGIAFGLAIASKITAVLFLPIIGLSLLFFLIKNRNLFLFFVICFMFFVSSYFTVRLAQPYLFSNSALITFSLNPKILQNWKELKSFDDTTGGFPPAVQWITTKPYLFPLKNMLFWGLGIPLGILAVLSIMYQVLCIIRLLFQKKKLSQILNTSHFILFLSTLWILILFIYQGGQFVKALRYFFPIYPFLAILSGYFVVRIINKYKIGLLGYLVIGLLIIVYPLSFVTIYSRLNSRVEASYWIFKNLPAGVTVSSEEWDDGLPVSLGNYIHEQYQKVQFPLYWPDNEEKWRKISADLEKTDYVILTSNRLYGSTMTYPQKYPITIKYYNALFDGSLGFEKVAEFTSRPNLPIPGIKLCLTPPFVRYGIVALKTQECNQTGISFVDDYADETFTVYDHPKVIIFKKVKTIDYLKVLSVTL